MAEEDLDTQDDSIASAEEDLQAEESTEAETAGDPSGEPSEDEPTPDSSESAPEQGGESGVSESVPADDAAAESRTDEPAAEELQQTGAADAGGETVEAAGESTPEADAESPDADPADTEGDDDGAHLPDQELLDTAASYDEELADSVESLLTYTDDLETSCDRLEARRDELQTTTDEQAERIETLEEQLQHTQADFQNYKKRAKKRQNDIEARATESLAERLLDIRDNLVRALDQDEDADIRDGVEATQRELDRILADENVEAIEPDPGSEVDPQRHEVIARVDSEEPEGTIAELYRPGYDMAEKVLRAAQVTVSE